MDTSVAAKLAQYMRTTPGTSHIIKQYMKNIPAPQRHGNAKDQVFHKAPTGGEWTKKIGYNPKKQEMSINFQSGFRAIYPGVYEKTFLSAKAGSTTKDGRSGSVGAWLHKNSDVMRVYKVPGGGHPNTENIYSW